MGKPWKQWQALFLGAPKSLQLVTAVMKIKAPWKKSYDPPRQHIKKQRHYFANKGPSSQSYSFSSSHVWMWDLYHKELSTKELILLNCGVGEDSWESLGLQGDQPVNPKGNQSWIFVGRTDAEAETSVIWPPDANNWLIWKDPNAGKDWRREEKGMAVDEMVGWHNWQWTWVWVYARSW